jgi:ankyrin repeat protein
VKVLVVGGSDTSAADEEGKSVLHLAAEVDDAEIVQFLLEKGAKLDTQVKKTIIFHRNYHRKKTIIFSMIWILFYYRKTKERCNERKLM